MLVPPGVRIAQGPEAARSADRVADVMERRDKWPYPWVYPPPGSLRRNPSGYLVMPAVTVESAVLTYQVDSGMVFDLHSVMFAAITTGGAPIGNPGDYQWSITRNQVGTAQAQYLADFYRVSFPYGSPAQGPIKLERAETIGPNDILQVRVFNSAGAFGAPNFAVALLAGCLRKA